jgi:cytochrome c553
MRIRLALPIAAALAAWACPASLAQPSAGPSFAPAHLTGNGPRDMAANCASCHGTRGHAAPGSTLPDLAGRAQGEIIAVMAEFKAGTRPATVMHQIAKGLTEPEVAAIALYFEQQR